MTGVVFQRERGAYSMASYVHLVQVVAIQQRRDLLPGGEPTNGPECTVAVEDLRQTIIQAVA